MNRADVRAGVRSSWAFVERLGIAQTVSAFEPLGVNEQFRDAALDVSKRYEEVYLVGLGQSHYSFILEDYGYFQFSCSVEDEVRYAYFPNPFLSVESGADLSELREFVDEGIMSLEDYLHRVGEMRSGQYSTPVRYENSPSQYVSLSHPTSHFHFGHHAENRWPLARILSPMAFTTLIAKQFYGSAWTDRRHRDRVTGANDLERVLTNEKAACEQLGHPHFSADERAQFFFD